MAQQDLDKRKRIMDAAISQYLQHGFESTKISEIAKEAGIAKGTIYLYFESKEALLEQVFWHCHHMDTDACRVGVDECGTAIEKLCKRADNAIRWALKNPRESAIEKMYFSSFREGRFFRYSCQYLHFQDIDSMIQEGINRKELKDLPSVLLGEMFYRGAGAVLSYVEAYPEAADNRDFWQKCMESIVNCLRP